MEIFLKSFTPFQAIFILHCIGFLSNLVLVKFILNSEVTIGSLIAYFILSFLGLIMLPIVIVTLLVILIGTFFDNKIISKILRKKLF